MKHFLRGTEEHVSRQSPWCRDESGEREVLGLELEDKRTLMLTNVCASLGMFGILPVESSLLICRKPRMELVARNLPRNTTHLLIQSAVLPKYTKLVCDKEYSVE